LSLLRELAEKFKKSHWGWLWTEAGQQQGIEQSFGIGGFGYPAMVALNSRKLKYSTLTGLILIFVFFWDNFLVGEIFKSSVQSSDFLPFYNSQFLKAHSEKLE